jgi:TPR repeat protein
MRRGSLLLFVIACGSPQPPATDVPHNAPPQPTAAELVARAARANAEHLPLDDARPFERTPVADSPAVGLYLDACRLGDRPACWLSMYLLEQDVRIRSLAAHAPGKVSPRWPEVTKLVEANCVAGHHASCLVLPSERDAHGLTFPAAPGAAGRSAVCEDAEKPGCQVVLLRRECDQGFAGSCSALSVLLAQQAMTSSSAALFTESDAAMRKAEELRAAGCWMRAGDECPPSPIAAAQLACDFGTRCSGLAKLYLEQGDKPRARDAAERGCQYFADSCAELGVMYLDGVLEEPVPGRGQRMVDFICDSLRRDQPKAFETYKPCKRAKVSPESE